MFARTTLPAFRSAARSAPIKQVSHPCIPKSGHETTPTNTPQNIRHYATPASAPKKSTGVLYGTFFGLLAGGAYYYYATSTPAAPAPLPPAEITLKGDGTWVDLPLVDIRQVTANTKLLRFALPSENHVSGLHVASAILTKYKGPNDEKPTIRPYTPVNDEDQRGYLELLVKR